MPRNILITGACGFTGRHLVNAFADAGHTVTATDLTLDTWRDDVRWVQADLRDDDAVHALCEGQDSVVHNASVIHTKRSMEPLIWDVNLGGAQRILAGCRMHGVKRLVYMSSASAVYEGKNIELGDESMPYSSISQAPYADSKIAAEKELLAASDDDLAIVALRPHIIFGPHDRRFLPAILKRAADGRMKFKVGTKRWLSDFTFIDNLIAATLSAEERCVPGSAVAGQAYFVTNGEPRPFFEFVEEFLEQLDLPKPQYAIPFAIAYAAATVNETLENFRGDNIDREDNFSRFTIKYLCTHHYFNIDKARRDLGYEPAVDLSEGIRRTVAHYKETGWS